LNDTKFSRKDDISLSILPMQMPNILGILRCLRILVLTTREYVSRTEMHLQLWETTQSIEALYFVVFLPSVMNKRVLSQRSWFLRGTYVYTLKFPQGCSALPLVVWERDIIFPAELCIVSMVNSIRTQELTPKSSNLPHDGRRPDSDD